MKIGLALGSGSARGIAHLGVLKALEEHKINVDFIAGASMGAFVGAAYAAGSPLSRLEEYAVQTTWQFAAKMFIPSFAKGGFVKGEKISDFLYQVIGVNDFDELKIPLAIDTTDLETGDKYSIISGELIPAVRASVAVPTVLTPKIINDRILVDGGLGSPIPIQTVRDMGADFVIAVDVTPKAVVSFRKSKYGFTNTLANGLKQNVLYRSLIREESIKESPEVLQQQVNILDVFLQSLKIGHAKLAEYQILLEKPDIVISPDTKGFSAHEFHKGQELINNAYNRTKKIISEGRIPGY